MDMFQVPAGKQSKLKIIGWEYTRDENRGDH